VFLLSGNALQGCCALFFGAAEKGEQNVTVRMVEQMCDRLKCKISELFGENTLS
jgi:hypothetical protein